MSNSCLTQLDSEHGWTQTSSLELQDFTETNATLWTMIRDFQKNHQGPLLPNHVLQGEAYNSAVVKKTQLDSMSERQRSQGLKFVLKSASAVPWCCSPQCTLTPSVSNVIDTNIIYAIQPNFLCASPALPGSFRNTVGPRHLRRNCKISQKQCFFVAYDKLFLEKSPLVHFW